MRHLSQGFRFVVSCGGLDATLGFQAGLAARIEAAQKRYDDAQRELNAFMEAVLNATRRLDDARGLCER